MSATEAAEAPAGGVMYLYRELWRLARGDRFQLLGAMALLMTAQVMLLGIPYFSSRAINTLQVDGVGGIGSAGLWLALVLAVTAGSWLLHGPGRVLERNVALRIRTRVTTNLIDKLVVLPMAWHESHHSGATAHRVQQSSHAISSFAQTQFIYLSSAVRLIGPVVALWIIEPVVGITALVGFAVISVSVLGFDRAMIRLAHKENDAERRYSATLIDSLANTNSLFALRQGRAISALVARRLSAVFEPMKRSIVLNEAKWCTVDIASKTLSCGLVALFAWWATRGAGAATQTLMLGSVYMVWEYAVQAGGVIAAIASHFQGFARQHADYTSADIIREAEPAHFASPTAADCASTWQRLDVRDLTFRHGKARNEAPTLNQVSVSLQRGKRYALIGGSGSGKSTLLRILAGLYSADRVVVNRDDGVAIVGQTEAARFLRSTATLIPQDAEVFEASLADNLALCESVSGPPSADEFAHALDVSRASDFLDVSPLGLQTMVAERGANWSGGQRSRVALARGVLSAKGSGLVLLDEPTAALDPRTESLVYENMFREFPDACVISSIHRLNLLDRFDEVIVMHEGRLVDCGSVATLAARSPEFRTLMAAHRQTADHPEDDGSQPKVA
jgi:ATP-binding cassette subfamily B protein